MFNRSRKLSGACSNNSLNKLAVTIFSYLCRFASVKSVLETSWSSSLALLSTSSSKVKPSASLNTGGNCRWSPTKTAFLPRIKGSSNSRGVAFETSSIMTTSKPSNSFSLKVRSFSLQVIATKLQLSRKGFSNSFQSN